MNQEEFAQVVVEATDSLYRVSFAILGNDTDCKDAISEAIVTAFSKLYTLRNANYAKTWLTRILIHECYRILKTRKRLLLAGDEMEKKIWNYSLKACHGTEMWKNKLRRRSSVKIGQQSHFL